MRVKIKSTMGRQYCLKVQRITNENRFILEQEFENFQQMSNSGNDHVYYAKKTGKIIKYVMSGKCDFVPKDAHNNQNGHHHHNSHENEPKWASQKHFPTRQRQPNFVLKETNAWTIPGGNPEDQQRDPNFATESDDTVQHSNIRRSQTQSPDWLRLDGHENEPNFIPDWTIPRGNPEDQRQGAQRDENPHETGSSWISGLRKRAVSKFVSAQFDNVYPGATVKISGTMYRIARSSNSYMEPYEKRVRVQSLNTWKKYCLKVLKIRPEYKWVIEADIEDMQKVSAADHSDIKYARQHGNTAVYLTKDCTAGLSLDDQGKPSHKSLDAMPSGSRFPRPNFSNSSEMDYFVLFSEIHSRNLNGRQECQEWERKKRDLMAC